MCYILSLIGENSMGLKILQPSLSLVSLVLKPVCDETIVLYTVC